MKLKVSEDKRFLIVSECTELELQQLEHSLTKKVNNWWIIQKQMKAKGRDTSGWRGEISFIDNYNRIPIGLWKYVVDLTKEYNFPIQFEGAQSFYDQDFNESDFDEWVEDYFKDAKTPDGEEFFPWDTQIESAKRAIKFRFMTQEVSMSGGKTLISFLIFRYLYDKGLVNKLIYVVPSVDLVTQSFDEWQEYEDMCGVENPPWRAEMIFSGSKKPKGEIQVTFGTYQSFAKRDTSFFSPYDMIIIDETHHAKAKSIKKIVTSCFNADWYRMGLTGTLPPKATADSLTIQAYLGPQVYTVSSHELISGKKATPIHVAQIHLDYLTTEQKKNLYQMRRAPDTDGKKGSQQLNLEKQLARDSRERFLEIVNTIAKTKKNSLVLFGDIKNGYGRRIYDWLKSNTDRQVYYIDGGTKKDNREYYKKQMEKNDDVIIVASSGTFSEGISIKNLHSIFITESNKSEQIIRQILGRGMRLFKGKDYVIVIDFADDFNYGSDKWQKTCYLMRHANERVNIYKERKFPFKIYKRELKKGVF